MNLSEVINFGKVKEYVSKITEPNKFEIPLFSCKQGVVVKTKSIDLEMLAEGSTEGAVHESLWQVSLKDLIDKQSKSPCKETAQMITLLERLLMLAQKRRLRIYEENANGIKQRRLEKKADTPSTNNVSESEYYILNSSLHKSLYFISQHTTIMHKRRICVDKKTLGKNTQILSSNLQQLYKPFGEELPIFKTIKDLIDSDILVPS
jgi:hypothetical protein